LAGELDGLAADGVAEDWVGELDDCTVGELDVWPPPQAPSSAGSTSAPLARSPTDLLVILYLQGQQHDRLKTPASVISPQRP